MANFAEISPMLEAGQVSQPQQSDFSVAVVSQKGDSCIFWVVSSDRISTWVCKKAIANITVIRLVGK